MKKKKKRPLTSHLPLTVEFYVISLFFSLKGKDLGVGLAFIFQKIMCFFIGICVSRREFDGCASSLTILSKKRGPHIQ